MKNLIFKSLDFVANNFFVVFFALSVAYIAIVAITHYL